MTLSVWIDAPEKKQPHGKEAAAALSKMVLGKEVIVHYTKSDRYRRVIGTIYHQPTRKATVRQVEGHEAHEEESVNCRLVSLGLAWHYKKYSKDTTLAEAERAARESGIGLWQTRSSIPHGHSGNANCYLKGWPRIPTQNEPHRLIW